MNNKTNVSNTNNEANHLPICCNDLEDCINKNILMYYPQYRGVFLYQKRGYSGFGQYYGYFIWNCPFCGKDLPKSLYGYVYNNAIAKTVGKDYCDITDDEIPEEFKTDEWWIKRGL